MIVFLYSLIQLFRWRCHVRWNAGFNYDLTMMEEEGSKGGGHRQGNDYSDGSSNLRIGIRSGEERVKDCWQNDSNRLLE